LSSACSTLIESRATIIATEAPTVAAAKAGDASCFEELVRRNKAKVFRLALGITGNQEDAEDAMQEAFIKAYQHLGKFRGDSLFSTWLTRIAVNEALQKLRKRRPHQISLDDSPDTIESLVPGDIQPWEPSPEQRYAQTELREIISKVIGELRPAYRVVLLLRDVEGLSSVETAQSLGLSVPAVKTRLLRGRLMLRSKLDKYFRKGPLD
jgi:RNA polymerase sigma-70 factor, ECF subfamily